MNILVEITKLPELIHNQIIAYYLWEFTQDNYFSRTPWDHPIKDNFYKSYNNETNKLKKITRKIFQNYDSLRETTEERDELIKIYKEAKDIYQNRIFNLSAEPIFCKVCHSTITKGYYLRNTQNHRDTKKHQKQLKAIYDMHYNLKYTPDKYFIWDSQYERYLE